MHSACSALLTACWRHFGVGTVPYPVMLCFGEEENIDKGKDDFMIGRIRKGVFAEYAGIDRRSVKSALESLEQEGLVKRLKNRSAWKVKSK